MRTLFLILLGMGIVIAVFYTIQSLWSFSAQRLRDYASEKPALDLREALRGNFTANGLIYDYTGRVNTRFTAQMRGEFTDEKGTLDEDFQYSHGQTDKRKWEITFLEDGKFYATAADVIGRAEGAQKGNAAVMRYRLKLPERSGGHVLNVVDWMYLLDDGTVINRSEMRKFGIKVAELFAVFYRNKADAEQIKSQAAE